MKLIKKIVLLSYVAVASTESAMLTPAFPKIQQDFMHTNGQLSWLMTIFLIGVGSSVFLNSSMQGRNS